MFQKSLPNPYGFRARTVGILEFEIYLLFVTLIYYIDIFLFPHVEIEVIIIPDIS